MPGPERDVSAASSSSIFESSWAHWDSSRMDGMIHLTFCGREKLPSVRRNIAGPDRPG